MRVGTKAGRARMRLIPGRLRRGGTHVAVPLRRGVYLMPTAITSIGLLAGFYSLISSVNNHFELAAFMITIAFVCDGLDGRVARLSRTSSAFGVEYDSLSDVVAFGVAPASLIYMWSLRPLGTVGWLVSGAYVVCAALRLARFNVQVGTIDKNRFAGLPVPGAAAVIAAIVLASSYMEIDSALWVGAIAAPITLILAGLMISRVPYPSFKTIDVHHRAPVETVLMVLVVIAFLLAMPQMTFFLFAAAYLLSGPFLLLRGERLAARVSVLRPVRAEAASTANGPGRASSLAATPADGPAHDGT